MQVNYANYWEENTQYWLPYSMGCLIAQAKTVPLLEEHFDYHLLFKREHPDIVLGQMEDPAIMGFSMYVWNENYQLAIAKKVKEKWPECIIVFGGPSAVPLHLEEGVCDVYIDGEGELLFINLLMDVINGDELTREYETERIKDLNDLASPFTSGVFDQLVKDNPNVKWLTVFETDRGCPYQCTFCDWGGLIQTKIRKFALDRVKLDLDWMAHNHVVYMFCANANFGIFPDRDVFVAKYLRHLADQEYCEFEAVNVQYLKNNTEIAMIISNILGDISKGITLSKQSDTPEVLEAIKRKNISSERYNKMIQIGHDYDIVTYTELILPLPLETLDTWKEGLTNCLEHGQHTSIDVWPAGLLPKAEMDDPAYREKFGIKWIECVDYTKNNREKQKKDYDDEETVEKTKLVVETNTMSKPEVLKAYEFSWFVIRMHFCGYSQIYSRYLRGKYNVSYLDFYQRFIEKFEADVKTSYVLNNFRDLKGHFLETGVYKEIEDPLLKPKMGIHFFSGYARSYCYENKDYIMSLALETAREFGEISENIVNMQHAYVYDKDTQYPVSISCDYDIESGIDGPTEYLIRSKINNYLPRNATVEDNKDTVGVTKRRTGYRCFLDVINSKIEHVDVSLNIKKAIEKTEIYDNLIAKG